MQRSLILLFFLLEFSAQAQVQSRISVDGQQFDQRIFQDSLELSRYVNELQSQYLASNYFFAGLDSVVSKEDVVFVFLHKGRRFDSRIYIEGQQRRKLSTLLSNVTNDYANSGFPFAQIKFDSLSIEGEMLKGKIAIEEGPEIEYDSAFFFQPISTNKSYIFQLLEIEPGDRFDESNYRSIAKKVERSPFLEIKRSPDISFRKGKAKIFLDLEENKTNTFQGILGIQQDQAGRTIAIGSLDLNVQNLFSSGKELDFSWERYSENSQKLNIKYKHPFFLDSKITPSFNFDLLKQDTIFLTRNTGLGVSTFISPIINLSLEVQKTAGSLLTDDQLEISSQGLADFEKSMYKIELSKGRFNSLEGFKEDLIWRINAGVGRKQVRKNLSLQDSFYDTIQLETNFFQTEVDLTYQKKIRKRQAFYHNISSGLLRNTELLANELYRIGGLSSVRGFNEKFFFADYFISSRVELRSFFENRSYLYLFYDQLFYERRRFSEAPFGIGIGFALATSSGQFSFVLAAGKSKNQELDLSGIKAHFGYISRF